MNNSSLEKNLHRLKVPTPDPTVRERTLHRALITLRHAGNDWGVRGQTEQHRFFWRWAVVGCVIGAAFVALWLGGRTGWTDDALAEWRKTFQQMEAVFPGQLNAVIEQDGDVELDLAAEPAMPSEQPVLVEFSRGAQVLRVLSYSGRRVCVTLDGKETCFETLVTGNGNILLTGDDFLWDSQRPVPRVGYRVEARPLNPPS